MDRSRKEWKTIDEYIATFPKDVQRILQKLRLTIRKAAPGSVETISYQMPTFKLNGKGLVYFAAYKNHIGFYPIPSGIEAFEKELSPYKQGKVRSNFRSTSRFLTTWYEGSLHFERRKIWRGRGKGISPSASRTSGAIREMATEGI